MTLSETHLCPAPLHWSEKPDKWIAGSLPISRLSMSRSLSSSFCFFLHRGFVSGSVAMHVALHRVSIRTQDELS